MINPLIKKSVEAPPRKFFHHAVQVFRLNIAKLETLKVSLDAAAIKVLAQLAAQHVQHPTAFRIRQKAELLLRIAPIATHNRVGLVRLAENAFGALIHAVAHRVRSVLMPFVQRVVIRREAFVQPQVRPILAGDQIAKPLVGYFVRNQALAAAQRLGFNRMERAVVQYRQRCVFHSAPTEIIHADLIILCPRVRHADLAFKKAHDLLRVFE